MKTEQLTSKKQDLACRLILYVSAAVLGLVFCLRLNIPTMIDEVATAANSAYLAGYDWSQAVYAMGGCYFKAGYAFLYYPFVKLIKDPYIMYKACLTLNILIGSLIPVFAHIILSDSLNIKGGRAFLIALSTAVLPSTCLNLLYTKADAILIFLPWPITVLFLKLASISDDSETADRDRMIYSCILAVLTEYAYFSHTRGIVIILAVILSVIVTGCAVKRRTVEPFTFLSALVVMLIIDKLASAYMYDKVFADYGTLHSSASSYSFKTLLSILSKDGLGAFLKEFTGVVFNCLATSFGTAGIAVIGGITQIILYVKKKEQYTAEYIVFAVITLMIFIGTVAMSSIYFFPYVKNLLAGIDAHRGDWMVYGRYAACALGPVTVLGIVQLTSGKYHVNAAVKYCAAALYVLVTGLFIIWVVPCMEGIQSVSRNFITLCTFLKLDTYGATSAVFSGLKRAFLLAALLGFIIFVLMLAVSSLKKETRKKLAWLPFFLVLTASITVSIINYEKIRISRDSVLKERTSEVYAILSELAPHYGSFPVIVDSSAVDIKHYQYLLKDYRLGNRFTENILEDEYFIIAKKGYFVRDFYDDDYYVFTDFDYDNAVRDIVYVKGERLKNVLTDKGHNMVKYDGTLKRSPVSNSGI